MNFKLIILIGMIFFIVLAVVADAKMRASLKEKTRHKIEKLKQGKENKID